METAITVAIQKLSLNFNDKIPKTPKERFAIPTSVWNGFPAGQPIIAAMVLARNTWPINAQIDPIPTIINKNHNKKTSKTLFFVLSVLLKKRCKTAPIKVIAIKMYVISIINTITLLIELVKKIFLIRLLP